MDYGLITSSLSSLAALADLGKSAIGVRDAAQVTTIVAQMNDKVLAVQNNLYRHQAELMELQQKFHEAQLKIRDMEAREGERDRYELHEPYRGSFVYRLKGTINGEPSHMLCQTCFDTGRKSILQGDSSHVFCKPCGAVIQVRPSRDDSSYDASVDF